MINFDIIGKIKSKSRPRFTRNGRAYTAKTTSNYETFIQLSFLEANQKKIQGNKPILAIIKCYFEIPNSYSKKRKKACIEGLEYPTKKPDSDNIAKIVLDSLNKIAYDDDKQVVKLCIFKQYTEEQEKVNVKLLEL